MGNMGTDTLFVHETKAAASCRTPNASRLPAPTASAGAREKPSGSAARSNEAISGQTRCLCTNTKRQQAAALQALRAYQRPLHPLQRVKRHWDQPALPCESRARKNVLIKPHTGRYAARVSPNQMQVFESTLQRRLKAGLGRRRGQRHSVGKPAAQLNVAS